MEIFDTQAAATHCGLSKPTLERYRLTGDGPAFLKIGRKSVRYRLEDLNDWLVSRLRKSTSDQGEA
jgi:predicted DNA-binding transcriptional regulator AlpA